MHHTSFEGRQERSNHLQCSSFCYRWACYDYRPYLTGLTRTSSLSTVDKITEMLGTSYFSQIQSTEIKACCHTLTTVYYHPNHYQYVHAYYSKYIRVHIFNHVYMCLFGVHACMYVYDICDCGWDKGSWFFLLYGHW